MSPSSDRKKQRYISMLQEGAEGLGIPLDEKAVENFLCYLGELKRWGAKMNLTGPAGEEQIISRHFLDSLTLLPTLQALKCKKILDIGSGAGFPGIPLKIADPALEIVLMDSREKRVFFLKHIIRTLGISTGITAIKGRAESPQQAFISAFECVTARAFAPLSLLLPLSLPYLSDNAYIIAMKGPGGAEELREVSLKGLTPPRIVPTSTPGQAHENVLMIFKKV